MCPNTNKILSIYGIIYIRIIYKHTKKEDALYMTSNQYIWDKMAKSFHEMSSRSKILKNKYESVAKVILKTNPNSVLNLGCGSGLLECELIKNGFTGKMCGVDASVKMLELAEGLCGSKVEFRQLDLNKPIGITDKFDTIIAMNVMFFLENKEQFLGTVHNLLKDSNSKFILINPKSNKESSIMRFIFDHYRNTTFRGKMFIFVNEIINLPKYWGMAIGQLKIWRMSDRGEITLHAKDDIIAISRKVGLKVYYSEDYRESQSWLFVMGKK